MLLSNPDPAQLPLPGLEQQEPLKRGGFTPAESADTLLPVVVEILRKMTGLLENINESLDDLTTRVNDLDEGGYRGR